MTSADSFCPECGEGATEPEQRFCPIDGAELVEPPHRMSGEVLGEYFRILEPVGAGAHARVYRALQIGHGREVAVKVLTGDVDWDDEINQRFARESRVVSMLMHPNIVRPVDFGTDREHDVMYFAMEWVKGLELRRLIGGEALRLEPVLGIAHQICNGLYEAHRRGIVHRDLKPENVMLRRLADRTVWIKMLDFGVAKTVGDQTLTRTGHTVGTPHYMAPEQALGAEIDADADLYALGVILFEMLSGRLPFEDSVDARVMRMHVNRSPPTLRDVAPSRPDVPAELDALVNELLEKEPADRPGDAIEVRERIDHIRRTHGLSDPLREPETTGTPDEVDWMID